MRIKKSLLFCLLATALVNTKACADPPATGSTGTKSATDVKTTPKPLPTIVIPKVNPNALTPADKNYGGTSIYLIDKKLKKKKSDEALNSGQFKNKIQLPKSKKPASTPPGTMIDSGDDAAGKQLVPKSWVLPDLRFKKETVIDSAAYTPINTTDTVVGIANRTQQTCIIHVGANRSNFLVFCRDGQSISNDLLGKGNPTLTGSAGSVVSLDEDLVTLHSGFVVVETGKAPLAVANREIGISIPPRSTVAVEYTPGASMSVYCLSSDSHVKARTAASPDQVVQLKTGQKVFLDTNGTNQKDFSPAESDEIKSLASKGYNLNPPMRLLAAEGSEFWVKANGSLEFATGWIFADCPAGAEITSPLGQISATKNAYLSLESVPGYFRIASCSGPGAVTASTENHRIPLDRGEEVLICDHMPSDEEVAAGDGILRRGVQALQEKDGNVIVFDDFSIYSLLYNCSHLRPLRLAKSRVDRKTLESLVTSVAEVQFSTAGRGDYTDQPKLGKVTPISQSNSKSRSLISKKIN